MGGRGPGTACSSGSPGGALSAWVLDTGALVALQRDRGRLLAVLDAAADVKLKLRAPAVVLTEFLGGSPRRLRPAADHVASYLEVDTVDEPLARRASVLLRRSLDSGGGGRPSAVDALVAAHAEALAGWLVYDGDRADFEALAAASGSIELRELQDVTRAP